MRATCTLLLLLTAFFLGEGVVSACLCQPGTVKEIVKRLKKESFAICRGRVVKVHPIDFSSRNSARSWQQSIDFQVSGVWKGELRKEITIRTGGGCAASFSEGQEYLLYLDKEKDGSLYTDMCMRPVPFSKDLIDLKMLGKEKEPLPSTDR